MTEKRDYQLLSILVPMYNEEAVINKFFEKIIPILQNLQHSFEIICVNDGSQDKTLQKLTEQQANIKEIRIIDLHRNFGKEAALTCAIDYAKGDITIPMDADLQDPPELIPELIAKWQEGFDEVLAIRSSRKEDSFIKRSSANLFYKLFNKVSGIKMQANAGDFRLIDKTILKAAQQLKERNRFMKGLLNWSSNGNTAKVYYERKHRAAGDTKWSFLKLCNLAVDGITAFSSFPLRIWGYMGFLISSLAVAYLVIILIKTIVFGRHVPGYASIMCTILFLGGIQLISLGVIGEYIAKIYNENKKRPIYLVKNKKPKTARSNLLKLN